jgi:hypothetical protein
MSFFTSSGMKDSCTFMLLNILMKPSETATPEAVFPEAKKRWQRDPEKNRAAAPAAGI